MTPVFCCGFECGVLSTVDLEQHVFIVGSVAFTTSTKRSGARALRVNPTVGFAYGYVGLNLGNVSIVVMRAYVNVTSNPIVSSGILGFQDNAGSTQAGLAYDTVSGQYFAGFDDGATVTKGSTGVTLSAGWHLIDVKVDVSANPWKCDVQVDGTALGQASLAAAASTCDPAIFCGNYLAGIETFDVTYDDCLVSKTAGDYPLGAGYVNHFVPTSDGTHNIAGANDFERGDTGTDIINSTTDAYLLIDEVPLPSGTVNEADCQRAVDPISTDYVECVFGPAPGISTPTVGPRAVEAVLAYHQAGTGPGIERVFLNDNGTTGEILDTGTAAGVTTYRYKSAQFADPPSAASAWTVVAGNGNFNTRANVKARGRKVA